MRKTTRNSEAALFSTNIFNLSRLIIQINDLKKFYLDWTKNVTFIVFTWFQYSHIQSKPDESNLPGPTAKA